MEAIDLSTPMRQSSKGILIIFGYRLFSFLKKTFILLLASIVTLLKKDTFQTVKPSFIIAGFIALMLILLAIAILRYLHFKFFLRNDEFHLKTGILNKETTILSKSKIQNVYIKETFLHRLIGVVALNIETAGDSKSEIEINALDKSTANLLKKKLFQTIQSEEARDDLEVDPEIYYRVSLKKLFLEGLTQNHFKSLMIIFGFFVGLYYENKELVEEYDLEDKIANWLHLDDQLLANIFLFNLVVLMVGLIISIIVSTVKMIVQNFDLKVVEHQKTFEISKGLIQTMTLTLSPDRIQNLIITSNRIKRKLGLYTLYVKQAMVNEKQSNNFSIVGLDLNTVSDLTKILALNYVDLGLSNRNFPEPFYKRVLFFRYVIIAVVLNLILINVIYWWTIISFLMSLLLVFLLVNKAFSKTHYTFDESYLTKGSGLIQTKINIMALHKLQSVTVVQNFFQARRGLATLKLTTASQKLTIPYIKKENAEMIADYFLYKLESQHRDWM